MKTLAQLKKDIQDFYADTSRSRGQTKAGLEAASEEIDGLLESLSDVEADEI